MRRCISIVGVLFAATLHRAEAQLSGPDLLLAELNGEPAGPGVEGLRLLGSNGFGISAYSVGIAACNVGRLPLSWDGTTNQHPVFAQNLYRLKDGRFSQIGLSWLKHTLGAIQGSMCGSCTPVASGLALGVGCSDVYSAGLNSFQGIQGSRTLVNPATGWFPVPPPPSLPQLSDIERRLQVADADLDPALNAGARYFIEAHGVHPDDAQLGIDGNNASFREVAVVTSGASFELVFCGPTEVGRPAIQGWKDIDPAVCLRDIDIPGDGRLTVGHRAIPLASGAFRHEFALHNSDSDRAAASFEVRFRAAAGIVNPGFHDVSYHSGDPQNSIDWVTAVSSDAVTWSCTETFAQNVDANALRWSTTYSFWFESESVPSEITIGLFKPGLPASVTIEFPFTLNLERTSFGDIRLHLGGVPPGTVEGYCLFSLDASLPAGAGPLLGLVPDALTATILDVAAAAGPPLHWIWPVVTPQFPAGDFVVPFSLAVAWTGLSLDGVGIGVGPAPGLFAVTPISRLSL